MKHNLPDAKNFCKNWNNCSHYDGMLCPEKCEKVPKKLIDLIICRDFGIDFDKFNQLFE